MRRAVRLSASPAGRNARRPALMMTVRDDAERFQHSPPLATFEARRQGQSTRRDAAAIRRALTRRTARRSVLLGEVGHIGRRHELERNVDLLVDALAGGELQRRIDRALALAGRVLEHRDLEIARLH